MSEKRMQDWLSAAGEWPHAFPASDFRCPASRVVVAAFVRRLVIDEPSPSLSLGGRGIGRGFAFDAQPKRVELGSAVVVVDAFGAFQEDDDSIDERHAEDFDEDFERVMGDHDAQDEIP